MNRATAVVSALATLPLLAVSGCSEDPVPLEANVEWVALSTSSFGFRVALVRPRDEGTLPHPVILALPWGFGNESLTEGFVDAYWGIEGPIRGYYVVSPAVFGERYETDGAEILAAIFEWMDAELQYDDTRVALTGASMGGRAIFFAGLADPDRFRALVGLPGQYAGPAADLSALAGKPVWLMVGERDTTWVAWSEETVAKLDSVGIDAQLDTIIGQGHVLGLGFASLFDGIDAALDYGRRPN